MTGFIYGFLVGGFVSTLILGVCEAVRRWPLRKLTVWPPPGTESLPFEDGVASGDVAAESDRSVG
jgi:hypothetical protein